jgi:aspartate/methionine/tyrosine aminotransferase
MDALERELVPADAPSLSRIPYTQIGEPGELALTMDRVRRLRHKRSKRLLVEERVGLAPGSAFGVGGEGSVRLCYVAEHSVLEPELERFGRFLAADAG